MVNITNLLDGIVAALRDIPALMEKFNGEPNNIYTYVPSYPANMQYFKAKYAMAPGTVMIAHRDYGPGQRNEGYYRHRIEQVYMPGPGQDVYEVIHQLSDGIVASCNLPFKLCQIHDQIYTPVDQVRGSWVTNPEKMDTHETVLFYSEIGFTS